MLVELTPIAVKFCGEPAGTVTQQTIGYKHRKLLTEKEQNEFVTAGVRNFALPDNCPLTSASKQLRQKWGLE